MKTPVSPAAYTNAILTVIAIALVLLVVNAYRVDVASPAQAQPAQSYSQSKNLYDLGRPSANTSPGSSRAPVDASNAPMSIDPVSAAAIHEVATANRAIAEAIRELACIATQVNDRTENIGARRLHTVMEKLLEQLSFDAPEHRERRIAIDVAFVREQLADIARDEDLSRYIL